MGRPQAVRGDKSEPEDLSRELWAEVRRLRALRALIDAGLIDYLGGNRPAGNHLVRVRRHGFTRLLRRDYKINVGHGKVRVDEAYWWSLGFADAAGRGAELVERDFAMPALVSTAEALEVYHAAGTPLTEDQVRRTLTRGGKLYPFYPLASRVRLSRDQVAADSDAAARARWADLERTLPPVVGEDLVRGYVPDPSPDPLPIGPVTDAGMTEARRRILALRIGHGEGWFHHEFSDAPADVYSSDTAGPDGDVSRDLPGEGVLPWVLGHADWHHQADMVAYRAGLGSRSV